MELICERPYSEARDAFKLWNLSSKPRQGDVFQSMKQSRARFKFQLRQCKRDEARIWADIIADDLVKRNTALFWSHVSKQNRRCIMPADTVGGATGRESIASMWKNHYANLFNCVDTVSDKEYVLDTISRVANVHDALFSDDEAMNGSNEWALSATNLLESGRSWDSTRCVSEQEHMSALKPLQPGTFCFLLGKGLPQTTSLVSSLPIPKQDLSHRLPNVSVRTFEPHIVSPSGETTNSWPLSINYG